MSGVEEVTNLMCDKRFPDPLLANQNHMPTIVFYCLQELVYQNIPTDTAVLRPRILKLLALEINFRYINDIPNG